MERVQALAAKAKDGDLSQQQEGFLDAAALCLLKRIEKAEKT